MANILTVQANAKINVYLRVIGRYDDGYHRLETIFQEIDFGDELTFQHASENSLSLTVEGYDLPADGSNLVVKAACLLKKEFGIKAGASITLKKVVPVGAGLGGGSSDAAASLRGLIELWKIPVSAQHVHDLAATLGADVPFFLHGGTGLGTGRGDCIRVLPDLPPKPLIILKPDISISTAWVYQHFKAENLRDDLTKLNHSINISTLIKRLSGEASYESLLINDLERVVLPRFPEVARLRSLLSLNGAEVALMTGSGSAVFGLFNDEETRDAAFTNLATEECFKIKTAFSSGRHVQGSECDGPD